MSSKTFFEQEVERLMKEESLPDHHYEYIRQSKAFMEKCYAEKIEFGRLRRQLLFHAFITSEYFSKYMAERLDNT